MIIQINKNESYQIDLPAKDEKVDANTLIGLKMRLDDIMKLLTKFSNNSEIATEIKKIKPHIKYNTKDSPLYSRDFAIELIKTYYSGDLDLRLAFCDKNKITMHTFKYYKSQFINKYSITPQEVGLKHFPTGNTGPLTKELLAKLKI